MVGAKVERVDGGAGDYAVRLETVNALIFLDHAGKVRVERVAEHATEPLAQHRHAFTLVALFHRRPEWNLELWQVAPLLLIANQAAAQLGVEGMHLHEHVDRCAGPRTETESL